MVRWIFAALAALALSGPVLAGPEGRIRVIDGDTLDVGGERVRLFGIDAPDLDQSRTRPGGARRAGGKWSAAGHK